MVQNSPPFYYACCYARLALIDGPPISAQTKVHVDLGCSLASAKPTRPANKPSIGWVLLAQKTRSRRHPSVLGQLTDATCALQGRLARAGLPTYRVATCAVS